MVEMESALNGGGMRLRGVVNHRPASGPSRNLRLRLIEFQPSALCLDN